MLFIIFIIISCILLSIIKILSRLGTSICFR
nr:MAG TPA: hypothetical protein [Caudoviricetes sp.]